MSSKKPPEDIAPEGKLWVCFACGRTQKNRYGGDGSGWDASCYVNSELVDETRLVIEGGLVREVLPEAK